MSYITIGATSSPAVVLQTMLKNFGFLTAADIDGDVGKKTMTAVLSLGRKALDDFAGAINGTKDADAKQIATGGMKGVQAKLDAAQKGGSFSGDFSSLQAAQSKMKAEWTKLIKAGGPGPTDRAAAFTSAVLVKPGSTRARETVSPVVDAPVVADTSMKSKLPLIVGGVLGVGALAFLLMRKT